MNLKIVLSVFIQSCSITENNTFDKTPELSPETRLEAEIKSKSLDFQRSSELYKKFIEFVNSAGLYKDSKDIVDLVPQYPLNEVLAEFDSEFNSTKDGLKNDNIENITNDNNIENITNDNSSKKKSSKNQKRKIEEFKNRNFQEPEFDLEEFPISINHFFDVYDDFDRMKSALFNTWQKLSKISKRLPQSSLISLKHPFIVPGGRFRELYYWDSYWTLRGLLRTNLIQEAKNMLKNFIEVIDKFNFFPNGTRTYYLNRTQQPYFTQMLLEAFKFKESFFGDLVLLEGLDAAVKELDWFDKNRRISYFKDGKEHFFYVFNVFSTSPRPESYKEDLKEFENSKENFYSNTASVAESGWDFSARWLRNRNDRNDIIIRDLFPADLNALMYKNFMAMGFFYRKLNEALSKKYYEKALNLKKSINEILWNASQQCWNDFDYKNTSLRSELFSISNLVPLFYEIEPPGSTIELVLEKHKKHLFSYPGGVPITEPFDTCTNEQWNFPNAWAPYQEMLVNFLRKKKKLKLALHSARAFFNNALKGFIEFRCFFEKYNAVTLGNSGAGGEYEPQVGFGWTNGTLIEFMDTFSKDLLYKDGESHEKSWNLIESGNYESLP